MGSLFRVLPRTILQTSTACGVHEERDGVGLVDCLRSEVLGDCRRQLGLRHILPGLESVVPFVPLESCHIQLGEVDRLQTSREGKVPLRGA